MALDEMTRRNLELVETLRGTGPEGTLLHVLDEACTPMGGRLLRRWLLAPAGAARIRSARGWTPWRSWWTGTPCAAPSATRWAACATWSGWPSRWAPGGPRRGRCWRSPPPSPACRRCWTALENAQRRHAVHPPRRDWIRWRTSARPSTTPSTPRRPSPSRTAASSARGSTADLDELRAIRDGAVDFIARLQATRARADGDRHAQGRLQPRLRVLPGGHAATSRSASPPTTTASRRWPTPSATTRRSSRSGRRRCWARRSASARWSSACSRSCARWRRARCRASSAWRTTWPRWTCWPRWPRWPCAATSCARRWTTGSRWRSAAAGTPSWRR